MAWLVCVMVAACSSKKQPPVKLPPPVLETGQSKEFNDITAKYESLSSAFVNWDSAKINPLSIELYAALINPKVKSWLLTDSTANRRNTYEEATGVLKKMGDEQSISSKRMLFNEFSLSVFALLHHPGLQGGKVYLQKCPMAFHDTGSGYWLSRDPEIRNPYLGIHHPEYKSGMLHCGETVDSSEN